MNILAIDPGNESSSYVMVKDGNPVSFEKDVENDRLATFLKLRNCPWILVIEQVAAMGMAVGKEVFETVFWSGIFWEAFPFPDKHRIKRHEIKMHLCGNMRAKDANIRQALIDRYGGKEKAIGNKKNPGPLRGISGDVWSALAVAVTYADTHHD